MQKGRQFLSQKFKDLDYFTETITWRHSKGETEFKTYSGAFVSIIVYIVFTYYAVLQFINMTNRADVSVGDEHYVDFYTIKDKFTGFPFAFGIHELRPKDNSTELDPDYGEVKAEMMVWNQTYAGKIDLKIRPCAVSDFDFDQSNPDSKFESVPQTKIEDFKLLIGSLRCIDEDVELYGSFNSLHASTLQFSFSQCNPAVRKTCKSKEQVKEWLKGKFMLFAHNNYTFKPKFFGDETFEKRVTIDWQRINIY